MRRCCEKWSVGCLIKSWIKCMPITDPLHKGGILPLPAAPGIQLPAILKGSSRGQQQHWVQMGFTLSTKGKNFIAKAGWGFCLQPAVDISDAKEKTRLLCPVCYRFIFTLQIEVPEQGKNKTSLFAMQKGHILSLFEVNRPPDVHVFECLLPSWWYDLGEIVRHLKVEPFVQSGFVLLYWSMR